MSTILFLLSREYTLKEAQAHVTVVLNWSRRNFRGNHRADYLPPPPPLPQINVYRGGIHSSIVQDQRSHTLFPRRHFCPDFLLARDELM
jgi:hypothetical protein